MATPKATPSKATVIHGPPPRTRTTYFDEIVATLLDYGVEGATYEVKRYKRYVLARDARARIMRGEVRSCDPEWNWTVGHDPDTDQGVLYVQL